MPTPVSDNSSLKIKFGGGVNSASSEDDLSEGECSTGYNFTLDLNNRNLRPRAPIEKIGTAPNLSEIRGFVNLVAADGSSTILVQAGGDVYNWSSVIGFDHVGSVSSSARLRGHLHHYWPLDDVVIITDLALVSPVLIWNGGTLSTMTHNLGGDFKAKYCWIDNERARFANVVSGTAVPHMIVTSEVSDYQTLSISDKPSSALGSADPYYLLTPDLRPVNGMVGFFDALAVSSEKGSIFKISGFDATDTAISSYYPRSFAVGDESMSFVGNDIVFGRTGRIESLISTQNYGDVATDDLSSVIKDQITDQSDWVVAYNPRTQKIYFHSDSNQEIWQYSKDVASQKVSPWVKLTTASSFLMNPTAMMVMVDPVDNVEYTYMGDNAGNIYRMEGTIGEHDAGSNDVTTVWRSALFKLDNQMLGEKFSGYVSYRSGEDTTITVKVLFAGSVPQDAICDIFLRGSTGGEYFGDDIYFGENIYFGTAFEGRFRREQFTPEGGSEEAQIEISHTGSADFEISEIGFNFNSKTNP